MLYLSYLIISYPILCPRLYLGLLSVSVFFQWVGLKTDFRTLTCYRTSLFKKMGFIPASWVAKCCQLIFNFISHREPFFSSPVLSQATVSCIFQDIEYFCFTTVLAIVIHCSPAFRSSSVSLLQLVQNAAARL